MHTKASVFHAMMRLKDIIATVKRERGVCWDLEVKATTFCNIDEVVQRTLQSSTLSP